MEMEKRTSEAAAFLEKRLPDRLRTALVLGSGLDPLARSSEALARIPYGDIPHFPLSTVEGHAGELLAARSGGATVLFLRGRVHYYEGLPLAEATFPIRVLRALGVENLILTNASGAIAEHLEPGDLVAVTDHINLMGANPLIGYAPVGREKRFVDLMGAYDATLREIAREEAEKSGIDLKEGVYAAMSGPSYETPAEIRFLKILGADLIGMSTVPEVIVAAQVGLRTLVISCVSNRAAGTGEGALDHSEVIDTAARVAKPFSELLRRVIARIDVP